MTNPKLSKELNDELLKIVLRKDNAREFALALDLLDDGTEHHWIDWAGYVCASIDEHAWRYKLGETPGGYDRLDDEESEEFIQ